MMAQRSYEKQENIGSKEKSMSRAKEHLLCFSIMLALLTKVAMVIGTVCILVWAWL